MRPLLYALAAAALWWAGAAGDDAACVALACGMVVAGVCLAALGRALARRVTCEVRARRPQVRRGDAARFDVALRNASRLPAGTFEMTAEVAFVGGQQAARAVDLAGTASARSELTVPLVADAGHCGVLRARVSSLTTHDPAGLTRVRTRPAGAEARVLVLPRRSGDVVILAGPHPQDDGGAAGASAAAGGVEPPDVADVRAWRHGDALHSVHWKLSARTGQTMVKLYEQAPHQGLELYCNLTYKVDPDASDPAGPTPDETDALLEATADLSDALLAAGLAHRLAWGPGVGCAHDVTCADDVDACCRELVLRATSGVRAAENADPQVWREGDEGGAQLELGYDLKLRFRNRVIADLATTGEGPRVVDLADVVSEVRHGA